MIILEQIRNDVKDAMRAKDKERLETLRLVTAAIKQIEVDERISVDEQRVLQILDKLCKQRKESIAQFAQANRQDLVDKENAQLIIIEHYLPTPLTEEEIHQIISQAMDDTKASSVADMGKVMALVKPALQGRADMSKVSVLIKSKLN